MPYIGKQIGIGNYQVLDALTATTTDTYALTKNSVAVFPQTPANCIVSLNGVIQAPFSSYNISGSNIVFASALTGSDSIDFITVLGDVLNVGTVSDGTIGLAKLSATGTKDATTFLRGDNTFASAGGTNTPAFSVKTSAIQNATTSTWTILNFDTEIYDTDNAFNTTNKRFTVPTGKGGKYHFNISVGYRNAGTFDIVQIRLTKNGTEIFKNLTTHTYNGGLSQYQNANLNVDVDLEANDYIEVSLYHDAGGNLEINEFSTAKNNFFQGYKLIE